jgi:hypothetical protein
VAYTPQWEPIGDALKRLVASGKPEREAKRDLCRAIAEDDIDFRVHLSADPNLYSPPTIVRAAEVDLPWRFSSDDIDWQKSQPLKPWSIHQQRLGESAIMFSARAAHLFERTIEMIEVSVADVARTLCAAEPARKAASVGAEKVRTTIASENDCRLALVQLMKAQPDNPIAKSELRKQFPQVSARGWNRVYRAAATEANAPAWSAPGRRPRKS